MGRRIENGLTPAWLRALCLLLLLCGFLGGSATAQTTTETLFSKMETDAILDCLLGQTCPYPYEPPDVDKDERIMSRPVCPSHQPLHARG
jgi:hypothetical protein